MNNFYEYWVNFESWRDFSLEGEHDPEDAHDRYEKRWMIKENDRKCKVCLCPSCVASSPLMTFPGFEFTCRACVCAPFVGVISSVVHVCVPPLVGRNRECLSFFDTARPMVRGQTRNVQEQTSERKSQECSVVFGVFHPFFFSERWK